jgi:hypothetical protein
MNHAASLSLEHSRRQAHGIELVETRRGPEIDQLAEHLGEVGLRVHASELAGFNQ